MSENRPPRRDFSFGVRDIPWWVGLVGLVAMIYVLGYLPSELRPLPVLLTIPAAGERDVPLNTELQLQFEAGGYGQAFDTPTPQARVTYLDGPKEGPVPIASVTSRGDILRVVLAQPLLPGRHVQVAVATRYAGRDLVWTFFTSADPSVRATLLPPPE